ncbi:OmpA family protein [Anaplasmataceae bacterium AB001_6]|nr:OmpA family protein [Anaplasmataceae bacterium AB001_6]
MPDNSERPIIIKKIYKKKVSGAHGGNWKVAYADFVTAMMVFFLLMWLLATLSPDVIAELKDYFGSEEFETKKFSAATSSKLNQQDAGKISEQSRILSILQTQLQIASIDNILTIFKRDNDIVISLESSNGKLLFPNSSADLTESAKKSINYMAKVLYQISYPMAVSSYNSFGEAKNTAPGSWQLSVNRAINVRNLLITYGIKENTITTVSGHSDINPKKDTNIQDISNRRIEIIISIPTKDN